MTVFIICALCTDSGSCAAVARAIPNFAARTNVTIYAAAKTAAVIAVQSKSASIAVTNTILSTAMLLLL